MDKNNELRFSMIQRVCNFLNLNRAVWGANTRISERHAQLLTCCSAIQAMNAAFVNGGTTGDTEAQSAALYQATEAVLRLSNAVLEWAMSNNDLSLRKLVRCSSSDIAHMRHADAVDRLNQLYAVSESEIPNIPGCSLTPDDFRIARVKIDAYIAIKASKSQKTTARKAARLNIESQLVKTTPILKQMDLLIDLYETTQPDFCQEYKLNRKVLQTGGPKKARSPKPKAADAAGKRATDPQSGKPQAGTEPKSDHPDSGEVAA